MNELIKQAADQSSDPGIYALIARNFLSFIKKRGVELVRGDENNPYEQSDKSWQEMTQWMLHNIWNRAYAAGAAKERERMGKLMERVGKIGDWTYNCDSKKWMMLHGKEESVWTYIFKTTSELIEIFNTQNKER